MFRKLKASIFKSVTINPKKFQALDTATSARFWLLVSVSANKFCKSAIEPIPRRSNLLILDNNVRLLHSSMCVVNYIRAKVFYYFKRKLPTCCSALPCNWWTPEGVQKMDHQMSHICITQCSNKVILWFLNQLHFKHLYTNHDNCVTLERTCTVVGLGFAVRRLSPELPGAHNANTKVLR